MIEPGGITSLSDGMFFACTKLQSMTIPEGVMSIGGSCFRSVGLKNIIYPSSVTTMGAEIHLYSRLSTFVILATTPPALSGNRMFSSGSTPTIYVPDEAVDAYKSATNWSTWASKIRPLSEYDG